MNPVFCLAIDGPAGSGKSTVAQKLAERFSLTHFDSGALYRSIAFFLMNKSVIESDPSEWITLLDSISFSFEENHLYLNQKKVGEEIRTPEVGRWASPVSSYPEVREKVNQSIRDMASGKTIVMEGRDIGTVVFPEANLKVFLEASLEERALRRRKEWEQEGIQRSFEETLEELKERDERDSQRVHAPLRPAEDAIVLDTTDLTLEEVVSTIGIWVDAIWKGKSP